MRAIVADPKSPQKHVWRTRIVVLSGAGLGTSAIMGETDKSKTCVWRWQERFMHEGVGGLLRDKPRPPGKAPIAPDRVAWIVRQMQQPPPHEATHWTLRAMAKAAGVAASTVQVIWKAHGLSPHRRRNFKLSNDPAFAEKLADIVGLYVDPPAVPSIYCIGPPNDGSVFRNGHQIDLVDFAIDHQQASPCSFCRFVPANTVQGHAGAGSVQVAAERN